VCRYCYSIDTTILAIRNLTVHLCIIIVVIIILLGDLRKKLMVPEQAQLLLANLNRASAILRDEHLIADADAGLDALAILVVSAGADGDDLCFVELLDGGLGEEDTRGGFGFGLEALDEDAVEERGDGADGFDGGHFGGLGKGRTDEGGYHEN